MGVLEVDSTAVTGFVLGIRGESEGDRESTARREEKEEGQRQRADRETSKWWGGGDWK